MSQLPSPGSIPAFLRPLAYIAAFVFGGFSPFASANPPLVVIGDSIGEGVQAADAAWQTQIYTYGSWIAKQMDLELTVPYIQSSLFGAVGSTAGRARVFPAEIGANVSVSGADVGSVLDDRADASTPEESDDEIDLVMHPREMSQIEYVEAATPEIVLCWIGSNDALGAALSFDALDTSQLTSLEEFQQRYGELADRLGNLIVNHGTKVVFANVPNVTSIGFLVDRRAAEAFLGFPVDLPDGDFTTVVGLVLMSLAGNDNLMADPAFVLDAAEVARIEERIDQFNAVIDAEAAALGMPVVDINQWFQDAMVDPPRFFGLPLQTTMLRGIFSLDLVHPSNTAHALIANEFIAAMNQAFAMHIPAIGQNILNVIYLTDPSIDKDLDGRARGRLGVGLLESLAFLVGLTGDRNDFVPD